MNVTFGIKSFSSSKFFIVSSHITLKRLPPFVRMIDCANQKKVKKGYEYRDVKFIKGDAEDLGFTNDSFNALTINHFFS